MTTQTATRDESSTEDNLRAKLERFENATMADNLVAEIDEYDRLLEDKFEHFIKPKYLEGSSGYHHKMMLLLMDMHGSGGMFNLGGAYMGEGSSASLIGDEIVHTKPLDWRWCDGNIWRSTFLRKMRELAMEQLETSGERAFDGSWPNQWTIDAIYADCVPTIVLRDSRDIVAGLAITSNLKREFLRMERLRLYLSALISRGLLTAMGRIEPRNPDNFPSFAAHGEQESVDAWADALEVTRNLK